MKRLSACAESYFFLILAVICFGCTAPDVSGIKNSALNADSDSKMSEKSNSEAIDWDPRIEAPDLTKEEFTRMCAKILKSAHPELKVEIPEPLRIEYSRGKSEDSGCMQLENAWKSCASESGNRKEALKHYIGNIVDLFGETIEDPKEILKRVVPVVRTKESFGDSETFDTLVSKSIGADLFLIYALDKEHSIAYLNHQHRALVKLDDNALEERSKNNLRDLLRGKIKRIGETGFYMIVCGGDYETSILFLEEVLDAIKDKIQGGIVFSIPARDLLLIGGDQSPEVITKLRQITKKQFDTGDHVISDRLYRYDDGKITFYE